MLNEQMNNYRARIADLEGEEQILPTHLAEAIQYRSSAMLK